MHINGICDRYALITRQDCSNIDCRVVSVDKSLVQSAEDFRYCFGRLGKNRILSSNFYTACYFSKSQYLVRIGLWICPHSKKVDWLDGQSLSTPER